ncbi:MAG: hypothetical protein IPF67_18125 [Saprospiraceae bacterium]|nr:hypothetical protein [Candidatus Brachybacter algidus]
MSREVRSEVRVNEEKFLKETKDILMSLSERTAKRAKSGTEEHEPDKNGSRSGSCVCMD